MIRFLPHVAGLLFATPGWADDDPYAQTQPIGPQLAALLGTPCPTDRVTDVGATTDCGADGRVYQAVLPLDQGTNAWSQAHRELCSDEGLRRFIDGAWAPTADGTTGRAGPPGPSSAHLRHTMTVAHLEWTCRACPSCRRAVLAIEVTDPRRAPGDGAPQSPHPREAEILKVEQMVDKAMGAGKGVPLLSHGDSVVRAVALRRWGTQDTPPPWQHLEPLLGDPDPTVRRYALGWALDNYVPDRVPWMVQALKSSSPVAVDMALHACGGSGWTQEPSVRAALAVAAAKHPDPRVRARAERHLNKP